MRSERARVPRACHRLRRLGCAALVARPKWRRGGGGCARGHPCWGCARTEGQARAVEAVDRVDSRYQYPNTRSKKLSGNRKKCMKYNYRLQHISYTRPDFHARSPACASFHDPRSTATRYAKSYIKAISRVRSNSGEGKSPLPLTTVKSQSSAQFASIAEAITSASVERSVPSWGSSFRVTSPEPSRTSRVLASLSSCGAASH